MVLGDTADNDEVVGVILVGDVARSKVKSTKGGAGTRFAYFPCHATTSNGV